MLVAVPRRPADRNPRLPRLRLDGPAVVVEAALGHERADDVLVGRERPGPVQDELVCQELVQPLRVGVRIVADRMLVLGRDDLERPAQGFLELDEVGKRRADRAAPNHEPRGHVALLRVLRARLQQLGLDHQVAIGDGLLESLEINVGGLARGGPGDDRSLHARMGAQHQVADGPGHRRVLGQKIDEVLESIVGWSKTNRLRTSVVEVPRAAGCGCRGRRSAPTPSRSPGTRRRRSSRAPSGTAAVARVGHRQQVGPLGGSSRRRGR